MKLFGTVLVIVGVLVALIGAFLGADASTDNVGQGTGAIAVEISAGVLVASGWVLRNPM